MKDGKYSVGIIGLGPRGIYLGCEAFLQEGNYYLTCICDIVPEIADTVKAIVGCEVEAYTDVDKFLRHPDLDVVIVATNDKTHADIAVRVKQSLTVLKQNILMLSWTLMKHPGETL